MHGPDNAKRRPVLLREAATHLGWLLGGNVRRPDGLLAAWVDGSAPAFPYEEATGYLLTLLCALYRVTGDLRLAVDARRTARGLLNVAAQRAGFGRDRRVFLFDTAVCLRAFAAFRSTFPDAVQEAEFAPLQPAEQRWTQSAARLIATRAASLPCNAEETRTRWSARFNAHHLKAIHHLMPRLEASERATAVAAAREIVQTRCRDGLFHVGDDGAPVYLHAACYAAEGLLGLRADGALPESPGSEAVGMRLAALQTPEGGMPAWAPSAGPPVLAGDATAQTVRLWQCLDPHGFARPIARGLEFLRAHSHPDGGVYYATDRRHRNSWATIFAIQALIWQDGAAQPEWLA
jgi:hypothetical protein